MYKTTNNNLRGLASASQDLDSIWERMVSAYASKGTTDLKNLKNQRLTAEQLDPYFFRAVDAYKYQNSPDELFKFMDYIWAWSDGFGYSNNDSSKVFNFIAHDRLNYSFTTPGKANSPSYLVWLTFTMNNNGSIDKLTNWGNFRVAFSDMNQLAKTPVIATINVTRLSDATPIIIVGSKLIDGSSNQYTKHINSFGENVSWQSNWDWNTKNRTNAFLIKDGLGEGVYGLLANNRYLSANCQVGGTLPNAFGVWANPMKLHLGLSLIDNKDYISTYGAVANSCAGVSSLVYDCYSYEYLYYKYGANPLKLRDETNTKQLTNKHFSKVPEIYGIYQMPNGDYYWSADGIFFCDWTEPTPNTDPTNNENSTNKGKTMDIKCPTVSCYTETTDKKLYLNRVRVSSDDIPFTVRQKTTKCKPKDTQPKQKYYCDDNQIDEKIYRLLENMGGSANGGGVKPGAIGGFAR